MKLEIGGGLFPRGSGWLSIDLTANADIHHDLNTFPWPIDDESIHEVCSSHCLEHLDDPLRVLDEICRICVVGAPVEIRVPHPSSDLAMTAGHKHVFSPMAAVNMDKHFPDMFWKGKKRLKLQRIAYGPTEMLNEARGELPFLSGLSDEVVMKWIPRTCHECQFFYVVETNQITQREVQWNPW